MTTPIPGMPGLDELRRAGLADDDGWPGHWNEVGCYCVAVEVSGVPYIMVNVEATIQYEELPEGGVDPDAAHWKFFHTIEEADDFVKVEAVKKRISK